MATTVKQHKQRQLRGQRRFATLLQKKVNGEEGIENKTIPIHHLAYASVHPTDCTVLVALAGLAVLHLGEDGEERVVAILRDHRQSFFGTALLHALHAQVALAVGGVSQEERIGWLAVRGGEEEYDLHCIVDSENLDVFDSLRFPLVGEAVFVQCEEDASTPVRRNGNLM